MNLIQAMRLAKKTGARVRPVIWKSINRRHWIECRLQGSHAVFVECGDLEEIPHALRLQHDTEFLGKWEVVP